MSKSTKWILASLLAVIVLLIAVKAATRKGGDGIRVTTETVKRRTVVETVSASGKLYPETEIRVASPTSGEVIALTVAEGDTVSKGQVLAQVRGEKTTSSPQRISLSNIPPQFQSMVQNMQPPRTTSSTSTSTITAPIAGTVFGLSVKQGERISPVQSTEILRIADMNNLEVRVDVNENNIIKIAIGDSADVEIEAYNRRKFRGVVTTITNGGSSKSPESFLSNSNAAAYEVHIKLDKASYADLFDTTHRGRLPFRPGMNARAEIKTARADNVLSVPISAVASKSAVNEDRSTVKNDGDEPADEPSFTDSLQEVVFIRKKDNTVEKRVIKTGIQDITSFQVLSGLSEGEEVVTGPYAAVSKTLKAGDKVTVVPKEKLFQNQ